MSFYTKKAPVVTVDSVAAALQLAMLANTSNTQDSAVTQAILTHENIGGVDAAIMKRLGDVEESIDTALAEAGVRDFLNEKVGLNLTGVSDHQRAHLERAVEKGMQAATIVLLGAADPSAYFAASFATAAYKGGGNTILLGDTGPVEITHETFEKQSFTDFLMVSAIANALAVATNPVAETFLRTVVLPANKPGIDMPVKVPHIYTRKNRSEDGSAFELVKRPIVHAIVDHTILETNSNEIHPFANPNGANDGVLVPAAKSFVDSVTLAGVGIPVRDLANGKLVDLISVSGHPALTKGNKQDETDVVANGVQVKHFGVEVKFGAAAGDVASLRLVVEGQQGTLFNPQVEGNTSGHILNYAGAVMVTSEDLTHDAVKIGAKATYATALGLAPGAKWFAKVALEAVGRAESNDGDYKVTLVSAEVVNVYSEAAGKPILITDATKLAAFKALFALSPLGWYPIARRTGSNMADTSTVCEEGNTYNYRIAVRPGAPLTTISPVVGEGNASSLDAVSMNIRTSIHNTIITEILKFETQLANAKHLPSNTTAVGGLVVIPTYHKAKLNMVTDVVVNESHKALEDYRTALVNAVTIMANRLIIDSQYLAALEVYTGSTSNFEVIVATDPHIASHLMTSGDGRTIGNDRKFTISSCLDKRLRDIILVSLRRTDTDTADMLSFGVFATSPSLLYTATTTRGNSVAREVHMIPRYRIAPTLPVMGRISVENMDKAFLNLIE